MNEKKYSEEDLATYLKEQLKDYVKKIRIEIIECWHFRMKFRCNLSPEEVSEREREVVGILPESVYPEDPWSIKLKMDDSDKEESKNEEESAEEYFARVDRAKISKRDKAFLKTAYKLKQKTKSERKIDEEKYYPQSDSEREGWWIYFAEC